MNMVSDLVRCIVILRILCYNQPLICVCLNGSLAALYFHDYHHFANQLRIVHSPISKAHTKNIHDPFHVHNKICIHHKIRHSNGCGIACKKHISPKLLSKDNSCPINKQGKSMQFTFHGEQHLCTHLGTSTCPTNLYSPDCSAYLQAYHLQRSTLRSSTPRAFI